MFYDIKSGCIIIDDPDVEFDINTFIYAFGHEVIHSIKARDDLFEKEKADESNIERGEN